MAVKAYQRSALFPKTTATFKLNEGASLGNAQDITDYVVNEPSLSESLTNSTLDLGGIILPSVGIKLNNRRGQWYKEGTFFKDGYINNSEIELETNYIDTLNDDVLETPGHKFKGLIKLSSCQWDVKKERFNASLIDVSNLLQSNETEPGILGNNISFAEAILKLVDRNFFTKHVTVSAGNINPGFDIAGVIDNSSAFFDNKSVKDNLDKLAFLSTSVYYIDQSGNFIVEPIAPASPTVIYNFVEEDIYDLQSLRYDWQGFINSYVWDDGESLPKITQMNNTVRESLQYDYKNRKIDYKFIKSQSNRESLMTNLLGITQYLKREVKFRCKWIPELRVNGYITLAVDLGVLLDDIDPMIWNEADSKWNGGVKWNHAAPGIRIDSSVKWRIIDIQRDLTGKQMTIKAKVTGTNADEGI